MTTEPVATTAPQAERPHTPLEVLRAIVLDTETTGFTPTVGDRVVEIACVDIIGTQVLDASAWSTLVHPGRPIPEGATKVHGITDDHVANAPRPAECAALVRHRIGESALVFHNAPFDLPFLEQFFRDGSMPGLDGLLVIDTLGIARFFHGVGSNSLSSLAARYQLPLERAHRATSDAITTAHLLMKFLPMLRAKGFHTVEQIAALSSDVMKRTTRYRR